MIDFIVKALPWVLAAIAAALAVVMFNDSKKKNIQINDNALGMGAGLGMIVGGVIGVLIKPIGMGVGVALGMLWGLVIGMVAGKDSKPVGKDKKK